MSSSYVACLYVWPIFSFMPIFLLSYTIAPLRYRQDLFAGSADVVADGKMSEPATTASPPRAVVIGLYGVPGSGKTYLLNRLKRELGEEDFAFYEGSSVIDSIVTGGLDAFKRIQEEEKEVWRQRAIESIRDECTSTGKAAVVTGHLMFWDEEEETGSSVVTQIDLSVYTHIIYLDVSSEVIQRRRQADTSRDRPPVTASHIRRWKEAEKAQLRSLCLTHGILFSLLSSRQDLTSLIKDFQVHNDCHNLRLALENVDDAIRADHDYLEKVVVLDADKTLGAEDTGLLWWETYVRVNELHGRVCPLKDVFSSPLKYSYLAFRQVTLMYEEANDEDFDVICSMTAETVTMHPEFVALLHQVSQFEHIRAVVVTSGLRLVWEKILERTGLSGTVKVVGGSRIQDGFVVTPEVKGAMIEHLQNTHKVEVWAFGDSPLDLNMLKNADQSIVVVGDEATRSKSMDSALADAIKDGLRARQVLLPISATPRLDAATLPVMKLTDQDFVDSLLSRRGNLHVVHATDKSAAKLLMTPMRDAALAGPRLREAHRQCGRYLALEYVSDLIGVEPCDILHVQGHNTTGFRLAREERTLIVALMRGGEPMAFGINDAFPRAMFLHASTPDNVQSHHLLGLSAVVLVDSVVNNGKTVVSFVRHIRSLDANVRIIVAAGVVQAQAVSSYSAIQALARYGELNVVALRLSDNKYTGSGGTDTGNRLFNTVHLP
ncbi:predicted protein [Aspergillus terreus NIH2624]|uniref:Phosphoribosyltransferase domain-containing protein n=1 Tax=Aspergillus terreus (strain NIH 2624 / FGSC A1156) TaxID=341663 RepID=Q0CK66_ASPTN|nr:uncharacterized protein ATEG_05918 [Aspergillus terreus NIH2624]EAU33679.1 predicted protein [Aspergillus terreus NIH2624]